MSESKTTTSHNVIRKWAEARCGRPATVRRTGDEEDPGLLRIDFPGYRGKQSLEEISWDAFFQKFDEKGLTFLYQDKTATGRPSRFCKFVSRGTAKARSHGDHAHGHGKADHTRTKPTSGARSKAKSGAR